MGFDTVVAIDGPAGSGKSVVGKALARSLGFAFFDTGGLYRAVTWLALLRGIDPNREESLAALATSTRMEVRVPMVDDGRHYTLIADGVDITWDLNRPEVSQAVSSVSVHGAVRKALLGQQREIAQRGSVVIVGRDIGTVIAPEARVKVFLTASPEVRAKRRTLQMAELNRPVSYEDALANVKHRDEIDSSRAEAPLSVPSDALVVDSSVMSLAEEIQLITQYARERLGIDGDGLSDGSR